MREIKTANYKGVNMRKLKKAFAISAILLSLAFTTAGTALAGVVYYKDVALSWDYGRRGLFNVNSFSTVQSGVFYHSSRANSTSSCWQKPGVVADAEQFVGFDKATAFWNASDTRPESPCSKPEPYCKYRSSVCRG